MKAILILALSLITTYAHAATPLTNRDEVAVALSKHRPMAIMFHAKWCGWCKKEEPEFAKAEQELKGKVDFYTVDIDQVKTGPGIKGVPTIVVLETKDKVGKTTISPGGYMDAAKIIDFINRALEDTTLAKGTM